MNTTETIIYTVKNQQYIKFLRIPQKNIQKRGWIQLDNYVMIPIKCNRCIINDTILIVNGHKWNKIFKRHIGKSVKFYKFFNMVYAYEADGKLTYIADQITSILPYISTFCILLMMFGLSINHKFRLDSNSISGLLK